MVKSDKVSPYYEQGTLLAGTDLLPPHLFPRPIQGAGGGDLQTPTGFGTRALLEGPPAPVPTGWMGHHFAEGTLL